jgi:hypothetical protein
MRTIMNANDLFNAVMQLDLTSIKIKLMHVESGEGWSLDKANAVEKEYRRFLCLMKLFPEEATAPLVDVDTFWHYHILDTMKYAADCEQVFGHFLHHYPYVGLDGTQENEQLRVDSGARTQQLYESLFGEAYPVSFDQDAQATAYCAGPMPPGEQDRTIGASASSVATAYCAGPMPPGKQIRRGGGRVVPPPSAGLAAATAYCAGPMPPGKQVRRKSLRTLPMSREILAATTAYCAGPMPPGKKTQDIDVGSLPASRTVLAATTAYCAGPMPPGKQTRTACQHA